MFYYRNTKDGRVIYVACPVFGDWELISEDKKPESAPEEKPKPKTRKRKA